MKKVLATLFASVALIGSAIAGPAVVINQNGVFIYPPSVTGKHYSSGNGHGYGNVPHHHYNQNFRWCDYRFSPHHPKNKNCVLPPRKHNKPPHGMWQKPDKPGRYVPYGYDIRNGYGR